MTVVVVDASVVVDLILDLPPHAPRIWKRLGTQTSWAAPHLLDAEVAHVLRNRVLRGKLSSVAALSALSDFVSLSIERFAHTALLQRAFDRRDSAPLYEALYVAPAEALDAPLLTRDRALAQFRESTLGSRSLLERTHLPSTLASVMPSISLGA